MRGVSFAVVGLYLVFVGGLIGGVLTGVLSDAVGGRTALTILMPVGCLGATAYLWAGSRHVRHDIAMVAAELREEEAELSRIAAGIGVDDLLQVRGLDVSYGPVQVLFDVSVSVPRGETLALLGTNGAGKSTLLRAVSGLTLPDRGVVRFEGRSITYTDPTERVRRGIVQVAGGKAVFGSLSVRENLLAGAHTFIWDATRVAERSDEVLELFPALVPLLDQPAGTLSGGEQQMLALAKALLLDPEVLLIDELSLGLAPVAVQEILATIDRLKARGLTMVIVEQSINVALAVADRAVFMEKGRIRFEGRTAELLERDDLARAVFLGIDGG
jgi:ABC-type branched-subunit amino acid transport system ATPase component